jgi:hypothetical protein
LFLITVEKNPKNQDLIRLNEERGNQYGMKVRYFGALKWESATIPQMLDAKIGEWRNEIPGSFSETDEVGAYMPGRRAGYYEQLSLREALNISVHNIVNYIFGSTWGPLWGKTEELRYVERLLRIEEPGDDVAWIGFQISATAAEVTHIQNGCFSAAI